MYHLEMQKYSISLKNTWNNSRKICEVKTVMFKMNYSFILKGEIFIDPGGRGRYSGEMEFRNQLDQQ